MAEQNLILVQGTEQNPTEYAPTFDDFWILYPRKVAKLAARKAWARIGPEQHVAILTAVTAWRQVWRDKDPEYIPHPASWLNGERWEDELPPGFTARTQQTAQIGPPRADQPALPMTPRTPLPDHVRALLGRLKGKL